MNTFSLEAREEAAGIWGMDFWLMDLGVPLSPFYPEDDFFDRVLRKRQH